MPKGTRAARPLPPDNFRANPGQWTQVYFPGGDVLFTWTYRVRDGAGRAASEQASGRPVAAGTPAAEGVFRVRIYDATGEVIRDMDEPGLTTTYENADLVADFGGEPAQFVAGLAVIAGSWESVERIITVRKAS